MGTADFFASELRARRKHFRLNQTELGLSIGVGRTTIGRWETGKALPNLAEIAALERALFLPEDELLAYAQMADPSLKRIAVQNPYTALVSEGAPESLDDRLDVVLRELQSIREEMGQEAGQTDEDREKNASG